MNKLKKVLSLLTILTMILSFFSISVNAEEVDQTTEDPATESTEEETPAEEEPAAEEETPAEEEPAAEEETPAEEEPVAEEDVPAEEEAEEPVPVSSDIYVDYIDSFQITLDETGVIISVVSLSVEGEELLTSLNPDEETEFDWTALSVEEAIGAIVDATEVPVDENGEEVLPELSLEVTSNDETALTELSESLAAAYEVEVGTELVESEALELEEDGEEQPEFIQARFEKAEELGITPGKMRLIEKLIDLMDLVEEEELSAEELEALAASSVKDIMSQAKEYRKGNVEETDEDIDLEVSDEDAEEAEVEEDEEETEVEEDEEDSTEVKPSGKSSKGRGNSKAKGKKK